MQKLLLAFVILAAVIFSVTEEASIDSPPLEYDHELDSPPPVIPTPPPDDSEDDDLGDLGHVDGKVQNHWYKKRGKGKPKICQDRHGAKYCARVASKNKCSKKKNRKRCAKTCGFCSIPECRDTGFNCDMATPFLCFQIWFYSECRKSCDLCGPEITTPEVDYECEDTGFNCVYADKLRCSLYWFKIGCKKTCGLCRVKTTTTEMTTTPEVTTMKTTMAETTTSQIDTTVAETTESETTTTPYKKKCRTTATTAETTTDREITGDCNDINQRNCVTWESLGFCYHEVFSVEMLRVCRKTCKAC